MSGNIRIPFYRHDLGEAELGAVADVFATPILTTGEFTEEFEGQFARMTGMPFTLGVTSCTGALHLALMSLGIGHGDEVITTPMSFIATATAILEAGATPVFADVDARTGNIDPAAVENAITPRTRAILPVHLYGLMCDMRRLRVIADEHGLAIVEDSAHCIEGSRDGIRPGHLSDAACYSFFATKNLTCGEGGAISVNDRELYEQLKLLRLHGMDRTAVDRHREGYRDWDMTQLGWKYNMSNIEAAILLPQLKRLERKMVSRQQLAARYTERLRGNPHIQLQAEVDGATHARHLFTAWIDHDRNAIIGGLRERGIEAVVNFRPIHLTHYFRELYGCKSGDFPEAESIGGRTVSLPFYPFMPAEYIDIVADALEEILTDARV